MTELNRRVDLLNEEKTILPRQVFFAFRPTPGETPDGIITRFELVRLTAIREVGLQMSWIGYAWLLLHNLGAPKPAWPNLLIPLNGSLPTDETVAFAY